jgi:hypothetical protein
MRVRFYDALAFTHLFFFFVKQVETPNTAKVEN